MVLRAATKDENVPRPRTSIIVAARDRVRATLEHFQPAHEYGPDAADARMVAWLDKLTNLSSSLRAEVSSPEFVKKKRRHSSVSSGWIEGAYAAKFQSGSNPLGWKCAFRSSAHPAARIRMAEMKSRLHSNRTDAVLSSFRRKSVFN